MCDCRFPGRASGGYSILRAPVRPNTSLSTETALIYDGVHLFARALHQLDQSQVHAVWSGAVLSTEQVINTRPLSCDGQDTWQHGNSLVNFMKLVSPGSLLHVDRLLTEAGAG